MLDLVTTTEPECPICSEPLSLRLQGEKLVSPACGHTLHAGCFTQVYGDPEQIRA